MDRVVDSGALGVAEYFTLTLAFGLLAAAALVAAIVAGMGGPLLAQVLAFANHRCGGAADRAADRETADDPSSTGARKQLCARREEGRGYRGVTGTQGLIKLSGGSVVGACAR